ncbi:phosphate acyltransferase PlsX [Peptostreptococcus canis]|uniref:Phosphate acyltransferase n=1 Tax=Peptostreptococcus canis TaxID=1159213 RepID=A0ABR6TKZ8_9FIRM|nr:phosphate acyltransferase PlsX [Peptostreptococcus canis]MBC2575666.1 phosphate acyltransferase PlsX [Peptostreptococcus canis]MBP1997129.1 glycerol-3-phosphate acyltransferase PlsX [Peptostreptococcus canis]
MKIVIDGMGGDNAPQSTVEGACLAVNEYGVDIILTGDETTLKNELKKHKYDESKIKIVHTTEVITNDEKPVYAIRRKTDSSMVVALKMVKNKEADVIISAGSTGALLSGGVFIVKRIKGISRPCICAALPTISGGVVMLSDTGANVDCNTQNLRDFAIMTDIYAKRVINIENPKVALANIGTEDGKGNDLVKSAFEEIKSIKGINFIGNMETREILNGVCDIVICDGFIGNIILKTVEGSVFSLFKKLKEVMTSTTKSKIGALMMKSELKKIKDLLDYSSYGGAPFLGVDGGVIKAHGSSDSRAIKNAVKQAIKLCEGNVVEEIKKNIK